MVRLPSSADAEGQPNTARVVSALGIVKVAVQGVWEGTLEKGDRACVRSLVGSRVSSR